MTLLAQLLAELKLQPGQKTSVQVNGYELEIHRPEEEADESMMQPMLEPWTSFPESCKTSSILLEKGEPSFPDPIDIPEEDFGLVLPTENFHTGLSQSGQNRP